jgi:hypothetical protein
MTRGIEPPELPDWAKEFAKSTQSINDAMQRALRGNQQVIQEAVEAAARQYATIVKPDFQRTIDQIQRLWLRSAPDNWHGLGDEALALTDLVQESGICLVWVDVAGDYRFDPTASKVAATPGSSCWQDAGRRRGLAAHLIAFHVGGEPRCRRNTTVGEIVPDDEAASTRPAQR